MARQRGHRAPVTEASDSSTDTGSLTYALEGEQSSRANEGEPLRERDERRDKIRDGSRSRGGSCGGGYIHIPNRVEPVLAPWAK
jgi:hypothetical protein